MVAHPKLAKKKNDTQTALASNSIVVEFFFLEFLFPTAQGTYGPCGDFDLLIDGPIVPNMAMMRRTNLETAIQRCRPEETRQIPRDSLGSCGWGSAGCVSRPIRIGRHHRYTHTHTHTHWMATRNASVSR